MTRGFGIWRCDGCATAVFPERLLCPNCHGSEFTAERTQTGVVEEISTIHHMIGETDWKPRRIASVRTDAGALITAGLLDDAETGTVVELIDEDGAPFARAREGG